MKWVLFCLLSINLFSQDTILRVEKDEFTGMTWFNPYEYWPRFTGFYVYFGLNKDSTLTPLRVKFHYYGDDWIFFDNVSVITNGNTYNFAFMRFQGTTEVSTGVFEIFDFSTEEVDKLGDMLNDLVKSGKAKVRYSGQYKYDFELQPFQIALIKKYVLGHSKLQERLAEQAVNKISFDSSQTAVEDTTFVSSGDTGASVVGIILFIVILASVGSIFFVISRPTKKSN